MFDVTSSEQIKTAIDGFVKENGPISGLVNNAGISKDQIVLRLKEEDISQIIDTNLKGAILVTAALSRSFLKAENVSIVNMSSVVGLMGNASQISYSASKAGLHGFTKSYAKELASRNVRANAICPGFIHTDMTNTLDDKVKEAYLSQIPLNRWGETEDVANLTCFLLSQASSYITGEIIKIDGGLYI
jgi:3-oxoacyl-[acyl-carrier protein] reductase